MRNSRQPLESVCYKTVLKVNVCFSAHAVKSNRFSLMLAPAAANTYLFSVLGKKRKQALRKVQVACESLHRAEDGTPAPNLREMDCIAQVVSCGKKGQ